MSMGTCREFARTSPKVSGRSLGEHVGRSPEEDHKTRRRECRRLPDCGTMGVPPSPRISSDCQRLNRPGWVAELLVPWN
ncbi:hypothetical protein BHE74_00022590 [Ensete ventricosum]|nr:hypothetical protein BHE74_00022590 [Ensete ventricosum]